MPVLIRETAVAERRWFWVLGGLYVLGLIWLLLIPIRFASQRVQLAVEMCMLLFLPPLLLGRRRHLASPALRITITTLVWLIFAVTMPFGCFACTEYMTYMHTDGPLAPLPDGYNSLSQQPILTVPARAGVIRAIRYNKFLAIDVPNIDVYLYRPVIPGIVHRVLLVRGERADTAMVRLVGPDLVEITIRRGYAHADDPPALLVVRRRLSP